MKRMTAILLAIVMVLGLCCGTAFAEAPRQTDEAREQEAELLAKTLAAEVTTVDAGFPDADPPAAEQTDGDEPDLTGIAERALPQPGATGTRPTPRTRTLTRKTRSPTGTRAPRRSMP